MTVIPSEGAKRRSRGTWDLRAWPRSLHSLRSVGMTALVMALAPSLSAHSLSAQAPATIDPGMTREQVLAKLGAPLSIRSYGSSTFLMYKNGCEKTCGINDVVVLDSNKVVDAIFRSAARKYTGKSSSPQMITRAQARRGPEKKP
jgi:hypothetical protein